MGVAVVVIGDAAAGGSATGKIVGVSLTAGGAAVQAGVILERVGSARIPTMTVIHRRCRADADACRRRCARPKAAARIRVLFVAISKASSSENAGLIFIVMLLFFLRFRSIARAGQALRWRVGRRTNRAGRQRPV